jgi:hypothetical protein
VPLDRDIDVDLAAKLAGVSLEEFRQLNPQVNKPVMLAAGTDQVLLPYDAAAQFVSRIQQYPGQLASWTAWVAPRTCARPRPPRWWAWTRTSCAASTASRQDAGQGRLHPAGARSPPAPPMSPPKWPTAA